MVRVVCCGCCYDRRPTRLEKHHSPGLAGVCVCVKRKSEKEKRKKRNRWEISACTAVLHNCQDGTVIYVAMLCCAVLCSGLPYARSDLVQR
jgi:hypothetical protein